MADVRSWAVELYDQDNDIRITVQIADEDEDFALDRALRRIVEPNDYDITVTDAGRYVPFDEKPWGDPYAAPGGHGL